MVVGVPVESKIFVEAHALNTVSYEDKGLTRPLLWMPVGNTCSHQGNDGTKTPTSRGINARLSRAACERAENHRVWMLERMLKLSMAAEDDLFLADGCPAERLTLLPPQQHE